MALVLGIILSVVRALAIRPLGMIVARGLQRLAAALMVPRSMAIIGRAYRREQHCTALGLWAAESIATASAGSILAGG